MAFLTNIRYVNGWGWVGVEGVMVLRGEASLAANVEFGYQRVDGSALKGWILYVQKMNKMDGRRTQRYLQLHSGHC